MELLIALMLFAMLSAALFAALRLSARTVDRVTAYGDDIESLTSARQVVNQWLASAYPKYETPEPVVKGRIYFDGQANSISFLGQSPLSRSPGGFAHVKFNIVGHAPDERLIVSANPELGWSPTADSAEETLLSGIETVEFAYLGQDSPIGPTYWHDSWTNRTVLPKLIRIRISFPNGDFRIWPDLLIAPKIRVDETCQFAPLTQSCVGR